MSATESFASIKRKFQWLLSPWVILGSLVAGVLVGINLPETAIKLAPAGDLYLRLLQMCVLPIMVTAIITSIARLLASGMSGRMLGRIMIVFCGGLLMASIIGLTSGLVGKPGTDLGNESRAVMGKLITSFSDDGQYFAPDMELYLDENQHDTTESSGDFLKELVPNNIFNALQKGHTLQILIFSMLLGVALSQISDNFRERLVNDLEAVFQAFILIIGWIMYLLPMALFFLIAKQVAGMGVEVLGAMTRYIFWVYIGCILLVLINGLVIALSTKKSFFQSFMLLKQPLLLSFFTRNGYAAMPSAIEVMRESFRINKNTANLVIPLGITICRFGTVMVFSLSVVFLSQLFTLELDSFTILFIAFASVIAGIASAGTPGVVALTMISMVLAPLGLPLEVALILLLAVDPITDPPLTLVNVHTNCAACSLIQGDTQ